ncbi:IS30 family transposase [Catellatospora sp. TT07R-123]|uniref:IS30 family transposase n=1 Tax=Catellatospora sp. TT07R-123 TaxID=2733863 RepID=UPI001B2830CE|nr:IS30 family transposase [Catellatospora sp. TT07R-123]GHJ44148.1 IS30 family transposase [Catellatospora sp. TT07R-123]GHJ44732.1 IS30 family transposase [Catellatospora sp. TT07R-123]GHJ50004.1 IS30 family transposase [Catellatospora sp. TT07R-123]
MPGKRLTAEQRATIQRCWAAGFTQVQIAIAVGVHASTVCREVARNGDDRYGPPHLRRRGPGGRLVRAYRLRYDAVLAQLRAGRRARRPKPAKLAVPGPLRDTVVAGLAKRWSPEQIAGRLRFAHPDAPEWHVSAETIYLAIYVQARGGLKDLFERPVLRTGRAHRRPAQPDGRRARFADLPHISTRPADAADRKTAGHHEGDLIIGAHGRSGIATVVERTTRYLTLTALPDHHDPAAVAEAVADRLTHLPRQLLRSLTWDRGFEMAHSHKLFTARTDCQVYFANPHSPWERGTNENTNGLLREYLPKGTDLSVHTQEHLDGVAAEINGRPRKILGFRTPAEVLQEQLIATTG